MEQAKLSLTWESFQKNICNGFSLLQQNGEFVDMTLAADGHFVKVHQMIMALASPYIKELINCANTPHPVILLNKISYRTLSEILEYVYTGEVLLPPENIPDLIEAGKSLQIRGLKDMKVQSSLQTESIKENLPVSTGMLTDTIDYIEDCHVESKSIPNEEGRLNATVEMTEKNQDEVETNTKLCFNSLTASVTIPVPQINKMQSTCETKENTVNKLCMQYTVSNQGSLQMILNRFVYFLKHSNRDGSRQWRCVNYYKGNVKCPAVVFTKGNVVTHRISAHTHPFHDKMILKKVREQAVFTAVKDAEREGKRKKDTNNSDP